MNPACQLCRGACCESIILQRPAGDDGRWLELHGTPLSPSRVELPVPCSMLKACGGCAIHDLRPRACRDYPVGGNECRATVVRRRPLQAAEIFASMNTKHHENTQAA